MSSPRSPSALRRPGASQTRDQDHTDPGSALPEEDDDLLVVGPNDATQVFDAGAAARALAAAAGPSYKLVVLAGPKAGAEYPLGSEELVVGRSADASLSIPDVSVSRRHASIQLRPDGTCVVTDLGSGNGTKINDAKVDSGVVRHGDEIAVGDTVLQLLEEGAPLPKKGRPSPKPRPSGAEQSAARPSGRSAPAPAASSGASGALTPQRKKLYIIAGAVLAVFVLLGVVAKMQRPTGGGQVVPQGPDAQALFREAKELAFQRDWVRAASKASEALELSGGDGVIEQFRDQVRLEATHQQALGEARSKAQAGAFVEARSLLDAIPREADVYSQVQGVREEITAALRDSLGEAQALAATDKEGARALVSRVLAVEPEMPAALALLAELDKPEKTVRTTSRPASPAPAASSRPVVAPPSTKNVAAGGPALEAYMAGDIQRAMRLAEDGGDDASTKLLKQLRTFDASYRQGLQQAQAKRAAEAAKALGQAVTIDRQITGGKKSKPGAEASLQLANMSYLLGIDCRGDEGLPCAARHFRAALAATGDHELAAKQLQKVEARAREIYTEAYVMKGSDPDRALKLFRISRDSLLSSDETHQKAARWYESLGGK